MVERAEHINTTSLANMSRCIARIRGASASEAYILGIEARLPLVSAAAAQRASSYLSSMDNPKKRARVGSKCLRECPEKLLASRTVMMREGSVRAHLSARTTFALEAGFASSTAWGSAMVHLRGTIAALNM